MKKLNLTDKRKPDYFYSEAIKTLRTNIQLSGQSIKTILVTSCFPNEGKSDVVLSLAQELGSIGKKVLLLDADIRKTAYAGRLGRFASLVADDTRYGYRLVRRCGGLRTLCGGCRSSRTGPGLRRRRFWRELRFRQGVEGESRVGRRQSQRCQHAGCKAAE